MTLRLALIALACWPAGSSDVRRGAYLVHHVARCADCHTPRDPAGRPLPDRILEGAPVPVASPYPHWDWAVRAPAIAGLGGWSDDDAARFLMTGIVPRTGREPRRPMPAYRLSEEDAKAVVAYLRSLK